MLQTKKRYISYSELYCFYEYGNDIYFQSYILGIRTPASPQMKYGSIIHKMLAEPNYDFEKNIVENKFTSDFIRIAKEINKNTPRCDKHEEGLFVECDDFCLYAGIDGIERERLTEYKTGASFWTQERVNENEQITHYTLSWWKKYNEILPFRLISMNTKNGKVKEFFTHRTKEQMENYYQKLLKFKEELIFLDWWDKKCPFNARVEI